jgi:exopolysaccharide biosynthesis polyprenyl glycosylphosphotransferase
MKRTKIDILFFITPIVLDLIIIDASMLLSYWIRFHSGIVPVTKGIPSIHYYITAGLGTGIIWAIIFYLLGLYESMRPPIITDDIYDTLKGCLIGIVITLAPTFFFRMFTFSRLTIVIAYILAVVLLCLERVLVKYLKIAIFKRGIGTNNVIVIGSKELTDNVINKLLNKPEIGFTILGRMGDGNRNKKSDIPFLGDISQLNDVINSNPVDTLILAYPAYEKNRAINILAACEDIPIQIMLYPDPYDILTSRIKNYNIGEFTLLAIKEFPFTYWNALLKRSFDILFSLFFLLLFSPLMLIITILIKCSSKGSILYLQERVGEHGKLFTIMKFRTMKQHAEKETGPVFARPDDKRTTKVGRILRKMSLDELPQLFNVLKGDMSLVGPRPERENFVEQFEKEIPRYKERHRGKPGITGWAQIHGLRGNTSIKQRVMYDLYYIENWSLGLDVKIILKTIYAVIKGEQAY